MKDEYDPKALAISLLMCWVCLILLVFSLLISHCGR